MTVRQDDLGFGGAAKEASKRLVQVSAPETPTNTIANTVRALAAKGFGHEDIVVRLKAGGMRISVNGAERIRQMVLKSRRPQMRKGLATAPGASLLPVTVQPPTRNAD